VASATSINFGGTALANYVEGTFTPTVTLVGGTGNVTPIFATNSGKYTRIGDRVLCTVELVNTSGGTAGNGTGQINVALPITGTASTSGELRLMSCGIGTNAASQKVLFGGIAASGTTIFLYKQDTLTDFTGADLNDANTRIIALNFSYQV
jgi:hypothetical protein